MAKKSDIKPTAYGTELMFENLRSNHKIKSRYMSAALAFILGIIGANQFYLGHVIKGILKILLTAICVGVGLVLDIPLIVIPFALSILAGFRYLIQSDVKFAKKNHIRTV